ncbi:thioesterase II family protein [Paenibacillus zanthoxyli]|uniref:thioesterase II family protein n=1 Tax=Paenibacillus zanthoxyli TaxID=369399 RepID=UPI00046EA4E4|nr:thioesterase domain-containing protein [Paenibacillus zanthoxyli]
MIDIYCFPPAGSSSIFFNNWNMNLSNNINVRSIELKGRGALIEEDLSDNLEEEVESIYQKIKNNICDHHYCFFGHSMGASLALELTFKLQERKSQLPLLLILSGVNPPNIVQMHRQLHGLPKGELIKELKLMGGSPESVLDNPEFLDYFLPLIVNDLKITENYCFNHVGKKINVPILVVNGSSDPYINFESILDWDKISRFKTEFYELQGGHFYLKKNEPIFFDLLNKLLEGRILNARV